LSAGNADLGLAGRVCWLPEQGFLHGSALIFRIVDGQADLGSHGPRNMPVWGYEFFGADADDETAHGEATRKVARPRGCGNPASVVLRMWVALPPICR